VKEYAPENEGSLIVCGLGMCHNQSCMMTRKIGDRNAKKERDMIDTKFIDYLFYSTKK
jgi:hypothetical protein